MSNIRTTRNQSARGNSHEESHSSDGSSAHSPSENSPAAAASAAPAPTQDPPSAAPPSRAALQQFGRQLRKKLQKGIIRCPRTIPDVQIVDLTRSTQHIFAALSAVLPPSIVQRCDVPGAISYWASIVCAEDSDEDQAPSAAPASAPLAPAEGSLARGHRTARRRQRRQRRRHRSTSSSSSDDESFSIDDWGEFVAETSTAPDESVIELSGEASSRPRRHRSRKGASSLASLSQLLVRSRVETWTTLNPALKQMRSPRRIQLSLFNNIQRSLRARQVSKRRLYCLLVGEYNKVPATTFLTKPSAELVALDAPSADITDFLAGLTAFITTLAPPLAATWARTQRTVASLAPAYPADSLMSFVWTVWDELLTTCEPTTSLEDLCADIREMPVRLRSGLLKAHELKSPSAPGPAAGTAQAPSASRNRRPRRTPIKDALGERLFTVLQRKGINVSSLVYETPVHIAGLQSVSADVRADPTLLGISAEDADRIREAQQRFRNRA